jgi:hypothetical protein
MGNQATPTGLFGERAASAFRSWRVALLPVLNQYLGHFLGNQLEQAMER